MSVCLCVYMCECVHACGTLACTRVVPFLPTCTGDDKVTARLCVCIIHVLAYYQHPSAQGMVKYLWIIKYIIYTCILCINLKMYFNICFVSYRGQKLLPKILQQLLISFIIMSPKMPLIPSELWIEH